MESQKAPIDVEKVKGTLKKFKTLTKVIRNPEQVGRERFLHAKNLHKLLILLRNAYPIGYSFQTLKEKLNIEYLWERQLDDLARDDLLIKRDFSDKAKKWHNQAFLKFFPEYVITSKGMDFLNSLEAHKMTRTMEKLTWLMAVFAIIAALDPLVAFATWLVSILS